MPTKPALEARADDFAEISEIRPVSEIQAALVAAAPDRGLAATWEPAYSVADPLEGDALSTSARRRSERPSAFDAIAFVEGPRVLTITWLPPAA